ncbi:MAG: hypothetical protein EAY75_17825 [Bacteroidetes bacterium]|nr:MAG: hypothetical protein EAY75_17825 [Bacteroidota bacterium]
MCFFASDGANKLNFRIIWAQTVAPNLSKVSPAHHPRAKTPKGFKPWMVLNKRCQIGHTKAVQMGDAWRINRLLSKLLQLCYGG